MSEDIKQSEPVKLNVPAIIGSVTAPASNNDSLIAGLNVRAILALMFGAAVIYMSITKTPVVEPLYTLTTVAVSFFFGHQAGQEAVKKTSNV